MVAYPPAMTASSDDNFVHGNHARRLAGFDYRDPDHAYFVTVSALRTAAPFRDPEFVRIVVDTLQWQRENKGTRLFAHCVMPDHLHLLLALGTESGRLGTIISAMKTFTTRQARQLGHTGSIWQDGFYDHVVRHGDDAVRIATYILENPVRKQLVPDAAAYPWSGTPDPL
jgi:putative transposase